MMILPSVGGGGGTTGGAAVVAFLSSGGMGQPGPQFPHFPCPPTCWPLSSTRVEHQALCSVRCAWFHVHVVYTTPLKRNGKMQGLPDDAPATVTQICSEIVDVNSDMRYMQLAHKHVSQPLRKENAPWKSRFGLFFVSVFLGDHSISETP